MKSLLEVKGPHMIAELCPSIGIPLHVGRSEASSCYLAWAWLCNMKEG